MFDDEFTADEIRLIQERMADLDDPSQWVSLEDLIAEYEKDPERKAALDRARARLRGALH
jgi:hypothetical protein